MNEKIMTQDLQSAEKGDLRSYFFYRLTPSYDAQSPLKKIRRNKI